MSDQNELLRKALAGDDAALKSIVHSVQDPDTVNAFYNGYFTLTADELRRVVGALTQNAPTAKVERDAWVPYLVDRADGVKGHYAIGRWNPRGFREVWNLHTHRWAAYSDDVMSLEEADSLLRQIVIPTVRVTPPASQASNPVA